MARAAVTASGSRIERGVIIAPTPDDRRFPAVETIVAEHPQPGPGSERGGREALRLAASVPADGDFLVLLSGGASSLMAVPADGISLDEKRAATALLLRAGADIHALNTVRKHMSGIKGGRLAAACAARCRTLVLSDVVGDDLSVIASGPTVADGSTYADALRIVNDCGCARTFPDRVMQYLTAGARGERPESPKPGDRRLLNTRTELVGGRRDAMQGAADAAASLGYAVAIMADALTGEARTAGERHVHEAIERTRTLTRPACVIASGETTVRVSGSGTGGRNQELTLAAAGLLDAVPGQAAFASVGTDGIDGPTDAAGAIADSSTIARARARGAGLPSAYLDDNNSYAFFQQLGDLVVTGPTGTNVGDLQIFLLA